MKWNEWGDCNHCGPKDRLPYLGDASKNSALLTTANSVTSSPHGTIVSHDTYQGKEPSAWINTLKSVHHIWYWINENDCDASRERGNAVLVKPLRASHKISTSPRRTCVQSPRDIFTKNYFSRLTLLEDWMGIRWEILQD